MRRVRQLPIETVIAIGVIAVALLTGAGVVATSAIEPDRNRSLASSGGPAPEPPATLAPPTTADDTTSPPTTRTRRPDDSVGAAPTTTVAPPPTTAPGPGETATPECTELLSDTFWRRTGDTEVLEAAAGASAELVEAVTNRADEPCRLVTSRCDATAALLTADGSPTDEPAEECASVLTEVVLEPGELRREELRVAFPVPPGEYLVRVSRYDGTTAELPVVLDDRLAACDSEGLTVSVNEGDLFRRLEEIVQTGLDVGLVLAGAEEACTLRVTESRVTLAQGEDEVEIVDDTERWTALDPGDEDRTHALVAPTELQPGDHEGTVTLVLADGGELVTPFRLLVG